MKKVLVLLCWGMTLIPGAFAQKTSMLTVASYNLRYNTPNDGVNAWPNRKENVKAQVRYHDFDIFGTQEVLIGQLKDLLEMKEYAYFGAGRDDGKEGGEHSAVFYKKDRFKVLDSGNFWLSETPDTEQIKEIQTLLNDSRSVTEMAPYGPEGTFNAFKFDAPLKTRIDYIFTSKGIKVLKYGVLVDAKDQRYFSDHQPVVIKAVL